LLVLVLLAACAPARQPFMPQPAETARLSASVFAASDGALLPMRSWLPRGKPRAVVVALHGMNDYAEAFALPAPLFTKERIAVYAYDQRGFGATPFPGLWGGSDNLARDAAEFTAQVAAKHPGVPIYILGESMGGAVAVLAVARHRLPVAGVVLSAPAFWGGDARLVLYRGLLWGMAHTAPGWQMMGSDLRIQATDNLALLERMARDPLIIKSTRVDAVYGLVGLLAEAYDAIGEVQPPVLLLYGGRDEVVPPYSIEVALARFSHPITFAYYPGGYHMLLRDLDNQPRLHDIAHWLRKPGSVLPSGHAREVDPARDTVVGESLKNP
jgi:acylglycerol lipase